MGNDIEIQEGHNSVCPIHKTSYHEYYGGCAADASLLKDRERAELRTTVNSQSIRARVLATTNGTCNGKVTIV